MNKLLKIVIGLTMALALVLGVGAFKASAATAPPQPLSMGDSGVNVTYLQDAMLSLGYSIPAGATGYFGLQTKAAVTAFQNTYASEVLAPLGLTSGTGYYGSLTAAKLAAILAGSPGPVVTGYPAGCTSTSGFSTTTGQPCAGTASTVPGCTTTAGYSPTTGQPCSSTTTTTTTLTGGAASIDLTSSSTDVEDLVKEGTSEKVLSFKVEADGGDVSLTNVKVSLANVGTDSEDLTDYASEVSVWMGSTEVGTMDTSDFSRESGAPDVFSKSIALSGAVIKEGVNQVFHVSVEANSNIDTDDITGSNWVVELNSIRFTDSTGAIIIETAGLVDEAVDDGDIDETFNFEDASADDDISIKSSSANPLASSLQVEADASSEEILVGAFKFDVDTESSNVSLNELPVYLEIAVNTIDNGAYTDADSIIDEVRVKIGSNWYDADLTDDATANTDFDGATGSTAYVVDFDTDEEVISAGSTVEVKVYVTFNSQDTNYDTGTTISASVVGTDIDAEGEDDDVLVTSSFSGKTHTLTTDAPVFTLFSKKLAISQPIDGVGVGEEDVFLAEFIFDVTAGDEDIYLPIATEDADDTNIALFTQLGGGDIDSIVFDANDGTLNDLTTSSFRITAGSKERFTLSFYIRANNQADKITINSFAYGFADDATGVANNATADLMYAELVDSGISTFATSPVYLAK